LLYGMLVALPAIIIGGPIFSRSLRHIDAKPLESFRTKELPSEELPGTWVSLFTALLPVLLLALASIFPFFLPADSPLTSAVSFLGKPSIVMLIVILIATCLLGLSRGKKMADITILYGEAIK